MSWNQMQMMNEMISKMMAKVALIPDDAIPLGSTLANVWDGMNKQDNAMLRMKQDAMFLDFQVFKTQINDRNWNNAYNKIKESRMI